MRFKLQNCNAISPDAIRDDGNHHLEPKFDGWRILAYIEEGHVIFYTRTGEASDGDNFPKIAVELLRAFPAETWIDGEIVALTDSGGHGPACDWSVVQSFAGSKNKVDVEGVCSFAIFDILCKADQDSRHIPLSKRRKLINDAIDLSINQNIFIVPQFPATREVHDRLIKLGYEGSVQKNDGPYASGKRGRGWDKIKAEYTADVVITGYADGKAGIKGMVGAVVFGQWKDGALVDRGKASGFDMKLRQDFTDKGDEYLDCVIEVRHNGVMKSGKLRHPRFIRFRDDKVPEDCDWRDQ